MQLKRTHAVNHLLSYIGPSSDHRTNRWRITCPRCGHAFEPRTTMFASASLACEGRKCGAELLVDYNAGTVVLKTDTPDNSNEKN